MHRDHDHHHHHHGNGGGGSIAISRGDAPGFAPPGAGHNHAPPPRHVAQWQTPHLDHHHGNGHADHGEADLDLVEKAFVEGFAAASDPTSFLRLARVPFEAVTPEGAKLVLLRVEMDMVTDVGGVTPHLGGETFRYDPLPAALVAHRRRLRFIYRGAVGLHPLGLGEVRALTQEA
jgi:hypothetical protein